MQSTKLTALIISFLLLGTVNQGYADFFVGADKTHLKAHIDWSGSGINHYFTHEPERLRVGYQGDFFGLEFHGYTETTDSSVNYIVFNNNTIKILDINTIKESYGAYLRMQEGWGVARVGLTWIDNYYTSTIIGVTDRDTIAMRTFTLGLEIPVIPGLFINADYNYAAGRARYPNITVVGEGLTDPTMRIQGFSAGVTLRF